MIPLSVVTLARKIGFGSTKIDCAKTAARYPQIPRNGSASRALHRQHRARDFSLKKRTAANENEQAANP
jgi:hypothetical protein